MRRGVLVMLVFAVGLGLSGRAHAHEVRPGYLQLTETGPGDFDVFWKVPARGELRLRLEVRFPSDCVVSSPISRTNTGDAWVDRWAVSCPEAPDGEVIKIEGLAGTITDVLVRVERADGSTQVQRVTPDAPRFRLEPTPGALGVARAYSVLGVEHILSGADHLLFVACLVILTGWTRRLLFVITGFTFAHSITLAAATLGLVHVPVAAVEATIALSIVFLATEIARDRDQSFTRRFPVVASIIFGLLHGFGFAAVLQEIGLPQSALPTALLFFNIGVEIGQLAYVGALALVATGAAWAWHLGARRPIPRLAPVAAAYAIGIIASLWTIERVAVFCAP